ncbi:peptidylprolyl isomerase fpr3 [Savitreella phatthalungensis]
MVKDIVKKPEPEVEDVDIYSSEDGSEYSDDDFLNPEFASILGAQQRVAALKTPAAMYGLVVPAGGELVPLIDDDEMDQCVRLTMASLDLTSESESTKPVILRVIRRPMIDYDDEDDEDDENDEDDDDDEEVEDDEDEDDEAELIDDEAEEEDEDEDGDSDENGDEELDSDLEDELDLFTEDYVLCTLKPGAVYQQTLDITFSEGEMIYFTVEGDVDVHLTGNYMTPVDSNGPIDEYDSDSDDFEDEYDSEDDDDFEDEEDEDDEDEEIDEIDARITELEEAEAAAKQGKKRRASTEVADLDDMMEEAASKPAAASKKDKKKLKGADGEAVSVPTIASAEEKKSVSFTNDTKGAVKTVAHGVTVDDRKVGEGQAVKNNSKVSIRYVGKLRSNNKQFDANTKGKPFSFTVGKGDCIKGMEAGVIGMKAGGERRIIIPAAAAYGSQKLPGIPANSDLIFDIKLLKIN